MQKSKTQSNGEFRPLGFSQQLTLDDVFKHLRESVGNDTQIVILQLNRYMMVLCLFVFVCSAANCLSKNYEVTLTLRQWPS